MQVNILLKLKVRTCFIFAYFLKFCFETKFIFANNNVKQNASRAKESEAECRTDDLTEIPFLNFRQA
jgi:hypothetical protein